MSKWQTKGPVALLRSLMNVRPAMPADEEFCTQDEYQSID